MSPLKSTYLALGPAILLVMAGSAFAQTPAQKAPAQKAPASKAAAQKAPASTTAAETRVAAAPDGGEPHYIKPETAEERRDRVGYEDPGPNPSPKTVFNRYGKPFTIFKVEKRFARYLPRVGWVRPLAQANFEREIYQENDKYIWVWNEVLDTPVADTDFQEYSQEDLLYFDTYRDEFSPLDVPAADVTVRFRESSGGLPTSGSWRNGGAVADMNEDGFVDLVLPPQRGQAGLPSIFLGDGKGAWTPWKIDFPKSINYGTVVVADFDKDKHLDLAFGIHLTGVGVFLGNGKGQFRQITTGLGEDFPTRRVVATDVDDDGWMDFVAISEGPVAIGKDSKPIVHGRLRAYLNRQKGKAWEGVDIAVKDEYIGGDFLASGNFNGDRFPDFIGASVYFNTPHILFMSNKKADYDPTFPGMLIPARSYFYATAAGPFVRGAKKDDALIAYSRYWPEDLEPKLVPKPPAPATSGIDRMTFIGDKPKRVPVVRWSGSTITAGLATGDFDGDGILDFAYTNDQKLQILLGDGSGGFRRAAVDGVNLPSQRMYDLKVADLNGDRRPDVMVMFEATETTAFALKNGSVRVYLNLGAQKQAAESE